MGDDLPGMRFMPKDEELVKHYLTPKVSNNNQALHRRTPEVIHSCELYGKNPEVLSKEYPPIQDMNNDVWYFFTPRERKYKNGRRPNRAAGDGYWKATGADKTVYNENGVAFGLKKALVFYVGKPPKGVKTNWVMHEWRVTEPAPIIRTSPDDMRLDNFVLCRIYKKSNNNTPIPQQEDVGAEINYATRQHIEDEYTDDNQPPNQSEPNNNNSSINQDQPSEVDDLGNIDPFNDYYRDIFNYTNPIFPLSGNYSLDHDHSFDQILNFSSENPICHSEESSPQLSHCWIMDPTFTEDLKPGYNVPLEGGVGLYNYPVQTPLRQFPALLECDMTLPDIKPGYDVRFDNYPTPSPISQYLDSSKQNGSGSNQFLDETPIWIPHVGHSFDIVDPMQRTHMNPDYQLMQARPGSHEFDPYRDSMKNNQTLKQNQTGPNDQVSREIF